eukprot:NODE_5948_length_478_cov_122.738928_g4475_i0.p1 GENE.NODE_5948_length_478_cov_122.738928_g4475_i0~~NODE_5948_length_478_cov_122.738928_g4475_i0.p1  ORF type:complete len:120 (+),score=29.69 NODE_5948_length_478_cov_122.738928_g4475_i0:27-362(+)
MGLDDLFAAYSYRSSTTREPECNRIVTDLMNTYASGEQEGRKRRIDRAQFTEAMKDGRFKFILTYFKHLIRQKGEPVVVAMGLAIPWWPLVCAPDSMIRDSREVKGSCVIS